MSFFRKTTIKATRKECCCYWCGEVMPIGSAKIYTSCVWEGDFFATNYHPECHAASLTWLKAEYGHSAGGELPDEHSMKRGGTEER